MDKAEMRRRLQDPEFYLPRFLKIRTKAGELVPFQMNPAQRRLYEALKEQDRQGKPMRAIVLKARQLGFSTLAEGLIFKMAATGFNRSGLIVAHREDSTANLFKMSKRFLENLPEPVRPMTRASNAREILFENPDKDERRRAEHPGLGSRIRCQTAGGGGIGRSDTLQMVHASEFAFWPGDKRETWIGIMQAVPAERGTLVIVESTANGYDEFHEMWEAAVRGESDFIPMFFPWFENGEYRKPVEPGTEWTEAEREMMADFGLDGEQLSWRRWCIANNCAGDERLFRQEYPAQPEEAFLTSGTPVFDNDLVDMRLRDAPEPVKVGSFEYDTDKDNPALIWNIRFREREDGCVKIYAEPKKDWPYVIGGDTAGEGSDWFTGQVIDNVTGVQAAVLRHQYDEDLYARQMYCLGRYYNWALLGPEVNFSTYPVGLLTMMKYPKQYIRRIPDTYRQKFRESYGWRTDPLTRPVAIAQLVQAFRENPEMVKDRETLKEMRVFARNIRGRPEAMPGEHDDLVMALAIALQIREQQTMTPPKGKRTTDGWTKDMWEDYHRAGPKMKAILRAKWGREIESGEDGRVEGETDQE